MPRGVAPGAATHLAPAVEHTGHGHDRGEHREQQHARLPDHREEHGRDGERGERADERERRRLGGLRPHGEGQGCGHAATMPRSCR